MNHSPTGGPGSVPAAEPHAAAATEGGPPLNTTAPRTATSGGPGSVPAAEPSHAAAATEGGPPGVLPERRHPSHKSVLVPRDSQAIILFVTLSTNNRQPVLANKAVEDCFLSAWSRAGIWMVGRYVIMPDHVHFFCSPTSWPIDSFHKWISYWKSLIARSFPIAHELPLWQRDCWDTQLRTGDSYSEKWAYVRNNPVRKGLVQHPDQWQFQGEMNALSWHE